MAALSAELETPLNVHRWRKLEGTDPAVYEALLKIQARTRASCPLKCHQCRYRPHWDASSHYVLESISVTGCTRTRTNSEHRRVHSHSTAMWVRHWPHVCPQPPVVQALQKRLLQKSEEVADRDLRLKEAVENCAELEAAAARLPGPEAAQQLALYQARRLTAPRHYLGQR